MKSMISVDEARNTILGNVRQVGVEVVPLVHAFGRTLAEDLRALRNLPAQDNSAMDGYAVRASDIQAVPARLEIVGSQIAGGEAPACTKPGQAVRIMTGAPIPAELDTVIMRELCDESAVEPRDPPAGAGVVVIQKAMPKGEAIRRLGEDVREGAIIAEAGAVITSPRLNLIAQAGHATVAVRNRPRVAVIASGDELVEVGVGFDDSRVINSNAHAICALCNAHGAEAVVVGIARDTLEDHVAAIAGARSFDIIITIGGVSVGTHDFVKPALEECGFHIDLWKVAMRPGKPLVVGKNADGQTAIGLPGNPVSSEVGFRLFVAPALAKSRGEAGDAPRVFPAVLCGEVFKKRKDLRYFSRGTIKREGDTLLATITAKQSSGQISGLAEADVLVICPEGKDEILPGDHVDVLFL